MGIALSGSQKAALRRDTNLLLAAGLNLDEVLEDLQTQIDGGVQSGTMERSDFIEEALARYQVSLMTVRNADGTVLTASAGAGVFGITAGGWSSGTLILTGEAAQNNTKTDTLSFEFTLPPEYVAGGDVKVNVQAKYAVSAGTTPTCTIDVQAYELTDAGAVGSDLCTTAAIAVTTSFADKTFTLTPTGLEVGDRLRVLVQTAIAEAGGTGTFTAQIGSIGMQLDIKG